MKSRFNFLRVTGLTVALALTGPAAFPFQAQINIDHIVGMTVDSGLVAGGPIQFYLRIANNSDQTVVGLYNAFRIYSPDGARWKPWFHRDIVIVCFPPCWPPPVPDSDYYGIWHNPLSYPSLIWKGQNPQIFDGGIYVVSDSPDGQGSDTVGFGGFAQQTGTGIFPGYNEIAWSIRIDSIYSSSIGRTLCIDSSFISPAGYWAWSGVTTLKPDWSGSSCFKIISCCEGRRGDVDCDGMPVSTIGDLTKLAAYLFRPNQSLVFQTAADMDGSGRIDITDLTYLVSYMFRGGPAPAACPEEGI